MFQHRVEKFGPYQKFILENKETGDCVSVVPECGACVLQVTLGGQDILDGYHTPEELEKMSWSKNVLLFPFPNRLKDGKYTFEGKTYEYPINNADTQNAIHGHGRAQAMEVTEIFADEQSAFITCVYQDAGLSPSFPFPHRFVVTFSLLASHRFEVAMSLHNEGASEMPAGLGWHPYFKLNDDVADLKMQLPDCQMIEIDGRMLPTGAQTPYKAFETLKNIGATVLDNGFTISDRSKNAEIRLVAPQGELRYWQQTGEQKFNFVQIFTPPHRNCVAIEPMSCNIDAFNNQDGLAVLKSQEYVGGSFGVAWIKG